MTTIFDPDELHAMTAELIGQPVESILPQLHAKLRDRWGDHIAADPPWLLNNAGGAMGSMWVLHFSITEYLIVFGSPIGTEGHSGRFFADDWFIILDGEQWAYDAGSLQREVYRPGEMHHMPRGTARGYRIPDHCWALEYARGMIPTMLPFGVADVVTSTLDWSSLGRTMATAGKFAVRELMKGKI